MPKNREVITTDIDTLKKLIAESSHSWLHKATVTILTCNMGLMVSVGFALISDHFAVKTLKESSAIHSTQIENLNSRETKSENQISVHDVKINNLERKR